LTTRRNGRNYPPRKIDGPSSDIIQQKQRRDVKTSQKKQLSYQTSPERKAVHTQKKKKNKERREKKKKKKKKEKKGKHTSRLLNEAASGSVKTNKNSFRKVERGRNKHSREKRGGWMGKKAQ